MRFLLNASAPFPATILAIHNRYRLFGGEDTVFDAETALLEAHGHRVERLVVDNRDIPDEAGLGGRVRLAVETAWSSRSARRAAQVAAELRPDVVHVHNFFPLLSPSIYGAARRSGAAIVQTLHNYRLVCPVATFYRDGHPCEDCLGRLVALPGIVHACYRDSRAATASVVAMLTVNRIRGTWTRDVDLYIAASELLREKVVAGLLPADRIVTKPNFVEPDREPGSDPNGPFLFVGRLTEDKGIATLLAAWDRVPPEIRLRVVGDGPLMAEVRAAADRLPNVEVVGKVSRPEVRANLHRARALVFSSRLYEGGLPLSIMEAFAAGLPVVGSRIGAVREIVEDGANGLFYDPTDPASLAERVTWLAAHEPERRRLADGALATYRARFTPDANYERLIDAYRLAAAHRAAPSPA